MTWTGDENLRRYVEERQATALRTYEINPDLLEEHVNQEDSFRSGGYGQRQISELLQNAVDALTGSRSSGTIEFRLAGGNLYCANEGLPFDEKGIRSVCAAFLSSKRDEDIIGRFGLGFKAVLGVSDNPQIFSRTASFEFNAPSTAELFAGIPTPDGRFPLMRVPSLLDAANEAASDPHLAELMTWASTIVKLPLMRDGARLREELNEFKTETLLFMKSVSQLNVTLQGAGDALTSVNHRREGDLDSGEVLLHGPDAEPKSWLFAERQYEPTEEILKTLTATLARKSMTVSYAVEKDGRSTLGEVWAWFPLQERTTTRGIFNAPWQVNDDRTTLLPASALNRQMLEVCGELFIDVVARASTPEDPGAHLDLFPARGREIRSIADSALSESIPRLARRRALIPDVDGVLRERDFFAGVPTLNVPVVPVAQMEAWQAAVHRKSMPHPSAFTTARDRFTRLRAIFRDDDAKPSRYEASVTDWLEEVAAPRTQQAIRAALQIFLALREGNFPAGSLATSRIIPTEDGEWFSVGDARSVLVPRDGEPRPDGVALVDSDFLDDGMRELFRRLGLANVSIDQTANALAATISRRWTDDDWDRLWSTLIRGSAGQAATVLVGIRERGFTVRVQSRTGEWRPANEIFANETMARTSETRHAGDIHSARIDLLRAAGCLDGPDCEFAVFDEPVFSDYKTAMTERLVKNARSERLSVDRVTFPDAIGVGPLQLLIELEDDKIFVADWTMRLLRELPSTTAKAFFSVLGSNTSTGVDVPSPDWWAIQRFGLVVTSLGLSRLSGVVNLALQEYGQFLPVVDREVGIHLSTPRTLDKVGDSTLDYFLKREGYRADSVRHLTDLLVEAASRERFASASAIPAMLDGTVVVRSRADVVIAGSAEDMTMLTEHGVAFVDGQAKNSERLVEVWGLRTSDEALSRSLEIRESGNEVPLLDRYPSLATRSAASLIRLRLRASPGIIRRTTSPTGVIESRQMSARVDDVIIVDDSLDEAATLSEVSRCLGLELSPGDIRGVLSDDDALRRSVLISKSRAAATDAHRLLALVGARILKGALPRGLLGAVESKNGTQSDLEVAELFRRVKGSDSLWVLREELRTLGLTVPRDWAGSDRAQSFVVSLGFSTGYAGTKEAVRPALQQVQGRLDLSPLHDFQETLVEKIRSLTLEKGHDREVQRGLLYLPTGAGKTRVTAEAVVRMFVANELTGPVLWIAQSQELCEQAIQSWTDAWRAFGDERALDINRFWGTYEVDESNEELQIVVATDDKLRSRIEADLATYRWLANATLVIIDEAHTAMSPTYTAILRWLGLTAAKTERPLLGLTATPYKGRNEEVNRLFTLRFSQNKLESLDPDDPIGQLRRAQVLAEVDHYVLDGSVVDALGTDVADFMRMKEVSKSMLDRIGQDMDRTQNVVDDILTHPASWPILVFAASVSSAHTIAALLRLEGKNADAVDGSMRPQERRRIIEAFRSGETQILVNCELLTQGFDAPKVRALYIARPTFSPNRYHQMIGRGLRGPKNGGKERCLIVNVADTFEQFGENLAFTEFNYLWEGR